MMALRLSPPGRRLKVLCLGAHSDDIEIGSGGTILTVLKDIRDAEFTWVVFSAGAARRKEAESAAKAFLAGSARATVVVHDFRDGYFPYIGGLIKDSFEALKRDVAPDLILTHYRADLHQDHRLISDLTWNTFRDHLIWEYEIPKYDGDLGTPNVYVPLEPAIHQAKVRYLREHFPSQADNQWFTESTFLALARLRGIECNAPSGHAEAFHCRKIVCA